MCSSAYCLADLFHYYPCMQVSALSPQTPIAETHRHIRTKAQPPQPLPQFREVLALLLEEGNQHVKLNVGDPSPLQLPQVHDRHNDDIRADPDSSTAKSTMTQTSCSA